MARSIRLLLALTVLLTLTAATVSNAAAGGRKVFDSAMTGIPTGGLALYGQTGGGLPWTLDEGTATLTADGRLHVEVQGLVLVLNHTNPISTGVAVVTCSGATAATTDAVAFSPAGDATVDATVSLPSPCLGPAVFFEGVTGGGPRWFAVTGF